MTSLSYCAPTPARYFFSASGIPSLSQVSLMSAGRSSQDSACFWVGLTHPGRLVLVFRDCLDDLVRYAAARLEKVVARLVRARESILDGVVRADVLNELNLRTG